MGPERNLTHGKERHKQDHPNVTNTERKGLAPTLESGSLLPAHRAPSVHGRTPAGLSAKQKKMTTPRGAAGKQGPEETPFLGVNEEMWRHAEGLPPGGPASLPGENLYCAQLRWVPEEATLVKE